MSSSATSDRSRRRLRSFRPTENIEIGRGLSLSPRLKLILTFFRSDLAVKPVDEWKLRVALVDFLRSSPDLSISDDNDLRISRRPDLHKRKRDEPVASGTLYLRDLGFLKIKSKREGEEDDEEVLRKKFLEWRPSVIDRLDGISLNLEGVKFKMTVAIPPGDDFDLMKKDWEDFYASQYLNSKRGVATRPDTIIVGSVPSRWFAEPQVSSKASLLISHDIFLVFGKIRNIDVGDDNYLGNEEGEYKESIIPGLNCKVRVQYENYDDFCNAMSALCGRSMQKQGSRLKVDYEVTWDKDGFFQNVQEKRASSFRQERSRSGYDMAGNMKNGTGRYQQNVIESDDAPRKRFRVSSVPRVAII